MTEEIKINFEMLGGFGLLTTKIPSQMVTSLNQYIDMHVIEENNSMSDRLVGQLNRTEKSSQLEIDMTIGTGEMLKTFLDGLGTSTLDLKWVILVVRHRQSIYGQMMHMKEIISLCICMDQKHQLVCLDSCI